MASTEQVRRWYPDVVTNHAQRGTDGFEPRCDLTHTVRVGFPAEGGGYYFEPVHRATEDAWVAYVTLMARFGETMPANGGVDSCRNIGDTDWPSLHAYCVAVDLPPNGRKSSAFQAAVLAIRTNSGAAVFKNLASINDRMHDQLDCSPQDLATGIDWATVGGPSMADHVHEPMPAELPREWADGTWERWVQRSGTIDDTRNHTFYREDLGWVYDRIIRPLEQEVSRLAAEVADLKNSGGSHNHDARYVRQGQSYRIG